MNFEAVIIGASTAGLIAAEKIARSGKKVIVYEQGKSLDPNRRTYIITPGILRVIPDLDPRLVRSKIEMITVQAGEQSASIDLAVPDLVIDRSELIESFYDRAIKAGAEVSFNSRFLGLGRNKIRVDVNGDELEVQAPFLIAADGVNSRVREQVSGERVPAVPLLQSEINLPPGWDHRETRVWFDPEQTSYFFWLIPDRDGKAVLGLIADPGTNIRGILDDFAAERDFQLGENQSGNAAYYSRKLNNVIQSGAIRILFAGDAAGQVKVTTVGGTVTGLMGGIAAARAVISGTEYQSELRVVNREMNLHLFIRDLMSKMSRKEYQYLVEGLTPSVKDFLSKYDRDRMRNHFWKLAFLQPAFIPLGAKLLVRYLANRSPL